MKHIGLFEGIGGFSLAARWMGWETGKKMALICVDEIIFILQDYEGKSKPILQYWKQVKDEINKL